MTTHMIEGIDYLVEGESMGWDHNPMKARSMVHRYWGWPGAAANLAADAIHAERARHPSGIKVVWLNDDMRRSQQAELIKVVPSITPAILTGLAVGSTRERGVTGRPVSAVTVRFSRSVTDDGLVTGILRAVANRLGASVTEVRDAVRFQGGGDGHIEILVNERSFDP